MNKTEEVIGFAYDYPQDSLISRKDGVPKDSFPNYFPHEIKYSIKDTVQFLKDSISIPEWKMSDDFYFTEGWCSSCLYAAKEPILYNYYLGYDRFRFLWMRSFHAPIIITISNQDGNILLETKKLDRYPQLLPRRVLSFDEKGGFKTDSIIEMD